MKRTTIIEIVILLYAILFLYTGISKLLDYSAFKETIADSPILAPIAKPIAWGLPWLEFVLTAMLFIPRWRLIGLYISLILMIAFTVYIIALLLLDHNLPCSCGGILQLLTWPQHLILNIAFIILATWAIVLERKEKEHQAIKWKNKYQITNLEY